MGGEDFSYYGHHVAACFFFVGSSPQNSKLMSVPHHCSHFDIDERALLVGSSIFVNLIDRNLIVIFSPVAFLLPSYRSNRLPH